jgi:hypothetical protein
VVNPFQQKQTIETMVLLGFTLRKQGPFLGRSFFGGWDENDLAILPVGAC